MYNTIMCMIKRGNTQSVIMCMKCVVKYKEKEKGSGRKGKWKGEGGREGGTCTHVYTLLSILKASCLLSKWIKLPSIF